jgi:predicted outer membrane repeat protein
MSQVRAKRARRWRLFNRAIARLRASWAPKPVTFDMLEQRRMLSSTLSIGNVALIEPANGIAAASFPLTLSEASASDVTVKYKTLSGTAKAGKDFVATSGSVVIPAGTLSENINISIIGGVSGDSIKQFWLKAVKVTNASISNNLAMGSITDDITPSLSVQSATTTEGTPHSLKLAVLLSGKSTSPVTVQWATADGGALAGIDYAASQGDLKFKPGQTAKKISVPIIGTSTPLSTEMFNVNLSNPTNAAVGTNGVETIIGTNGFNQIYIDDETITRPASGYKDLNFKVHLLNPSDGTISVQYATLPGTGSVGQYVSVTGTVEFLNGQTTTNISVPIVGSTFYYPQSTFYVQLTNPVDAQIADDEATGTINSNASAPAIPPPTASVNSISGNEGNSGDTPFTFNVTLSTPSAQPVVVYYQTQDGTAVDGTDYDGGAGAVYFPAGATSEPVTVQVIGNTTPELDKTFDLVLTGATNAYISTAPGVATIDNDDFATISVSNPPVSATSVGTSTTATFTVSLNEVSDVPITADYFTSDGTATVAGDDYDATSSTLTFAPGVTSQNVTVTVNGQGNTDIGDTFFLNLDNVTGPATPATAQGTATVIQAPSISVGNVTVDESNGGGRAATFTVSLSNVSTQTVAVNYATANGTAHAGTDYTSETGTLTFQPGASLSQTVTVPVGSNIEDGETFTLNLSTATNSTILDGQGTALLTNPPTVSVSDPTIPSTSGGTDTADFTISLSAPSLRSYWVSYSTSDGTATAPADYTTTSDTLEYSDGTWFILPNPPTNGISGGPVLDNEIVGTGNSVTIPVQVFPSPSIEDGSQFFLNLDGATALPFGTGEATLGTSSAAATFVNPPTVSVGNTSVTDSRSGTDVPANFLVTLSQASEHTVSVQYVTIDGTAQGGPDFVSATGTVTFPAGTTQETLTIQTTGNPNTEDGSQFGVEIMDPTNANIGTNEGTATITNTPSISISGASQDEGNSGTSPMQFAVHLSNPSLNTVGFDYYTSDGTASGGTDYTSESGGLDFAPGQTVAYIDVPIIGNTEYEPNKTFTLNLIDPTNGTLGTSSATGTILNDDPIPTIELSPASVEEGNSGITPMTFTVSLSNPSYQSISVEYYTSDDTANAGSDYQSTSGSVDFAPGQTSANVTVNVYGDTVAETDEDFFLNFSNPVNASLPTTQTTGTILNDDGGGISVNNVVVPESDENYVPTEAIFTITLATPYADTVDVQYATEDDSASGGVDYTSTSGSVDFAPGETQKIVTVPVLDTFSSSGSSDFILNLTSVSPGVPVDQGSGEATIIENDSLPGVSVSGSSVEESSDPESQQPMQFTVYVYGAHALPVTLDYSTGDDSASGGVDYTTTTGSLTFAPTTDTGTAQQTITVPVIGGNDPLNTTDFVLNLTNIQNANNYGSTAYGYINDDNVAPTVSIQSTASMEEHDQSNDGNMAFDVSLSHSYTQDVTVAYTTQDGTASGGVDYTPVNGTLTIPAGETDEDIEIPIIGNTTIEPNLTFSVILSDPTNATLDNSTATGTIINDNTVPQAYVTSNPVQEGDSGTTPDYFYINLTAPYSSPVTVDYYTSNGTAIGITDDPTSDYLSTSGSVTFEPDQTSIAIPVEINGNTIEQPNRDFYFNITSSDVTVQDSGTVLGIIQDDDEPSVGVSSPALIEPPSGTTQQEQFTVTLTSQNGAPLTYPVTMDYHTSGGQDEYASTSGSLDFAPGQTSMTVDVPVSGGADLDGNDQFNLIVTTHDPLNGDFTTTGTATVYANNDPSQTDMLINNPILAPVNTDTSSLSFDISNNGNQASGDYKIKFYAIAYTGSGGGDCYQIEAFDPSTNQLLKTIDPIGPGGDQSYSVEPLMVDANGNPIPAGYYTIKMVLSAPDYGFLTCSTTPNELPYTHTQVIWTGSGGDDQWSDPANWDTQAVPSIGDDVVIGNNDGNAIYYDGINTEVNSVFSDAPVILASGTLMVDENMQVNADFDLQGGELDNATILPGNCGQELVLTDEGGTLKNVIADANIDGGEYGDGATVNFDDSLELNGTLFLGDNSDDVATANFYTDNSACFKLTGDGIVNFGNNSDSEMSNYASMLTIGSGITITGYGGTINNPDGGYILNNGTITTDELDIEGNLVNNGLISPAGPGSIGVLFVDGNFTQNSGGSIYADLDIGGGDFDGIVISGQANLDGTLEYALASDTYPETGDTFDVIQANSINGTFATTTDAGTNPDYSFSVAYLDQVVELTADYIGPTTFYVDANSDASNPNGLSWSGAFDDLQDALALAHSGDTIDVAGGIYYPGVYQDDSFVIPDGVEIYGGFAGSASDDPDTRDLSLYTSYLSGDIGIPGDSSDNVYTVVAADYTGSHTRLDGFTVEYGNSNSYGGGLEASYSSMTIANCTFIDNEAERGGGAIAIYDSTATITSCTFDENGAGFGGGAIFVLGGSPTISDSTFTENDSFDVGGAIVFSGAYGPVSRCSFDGNEAQDGGAIAIEGSNVSIANSAFVSNTAYGYSGDDAESGYGGAVAALESKLTVTNSTFTDNVAMGQSGGDDYLGGYGGGIAASASSVTVTNSIMWNDYAAYGGEIYSGENSSVTVTYSDINQSDYGSQSTNINADPMFERAAGTYGPEDYGDLHLTITSPAINAGNDLASGIGATDLAGNPRVENGQIDLGAYESDAIYVDAGATGDNDGTTWTDAYTNLQSALNSAGDGDFIEVAGGTYNPGTDGNSQDTFDIPDGVAIYGGYAGSNNVDEPDLRSTSIYPTILSGDVGSPGNYSYHVVSASNISSYATRLDGFTITDGDANIGDNIYGGGMLITNSNLTVANCTFTRNIAGGGGAIYISSGTPSILDCVFQDNTATNGGGAIAMEDGSDVSITGSTFTNNRTTLSGAVGGAIFSNGDSLYILDSAFDGNTAIASGGAIANTDANLNVVNSTFAGNVSIGYTVEGSLYSGDGGAIADQNTNETSMTITNCTFTDNVAEGVTSGQNYTGGYGGAISGNTATATISNSIFWNNTAFTGNEIYSTETSIVTLTYSDIDDPDLAGGTGDIDAAPDFVRNPSPGIDGVWGTSDDDYGDLQLILGSAAIDSGNNSDVPNGVTTDIIGNPRIINSQDTFDQPDAIVDMGAYETYPVYVDLNAGSAVAFPDTNIQPAIDDTGSTWQFGFTDLGDALANVQSGQMIFIAGGDYYVGGDGPTGTFNVPTGVGIYGGFEGADSGTPDVRDETTTLIGQDANSDDVYHVVTMINPDNLNVLDTLTISSGNANGDGGDDVNGGGIFIRGGSAAINNTFLESDFATYGGGIYVDNATLTITGSATDGTSASYGGSIYEDSSTVVVNDTTFTSGGADIDAALYANGGTLNLDGDHFNYLRTAPGAGDNAAAIFLENGATAILNQDNFVNDSADSGGAIEAGAGTTLTITGGSFDGISANSSEGDGGAIFASGATVDITGVTFQSDSGYVGGVLYVGGASNVTLNADTFMLNSASLFGGAISADRSTLLANNSLFVLNTAGNEGDVLTGYLADITLNNVTMSGNNGSAENAITMTEGSLTVDNSILYGDLGPEINPTSVTVEVNNSDIEGGYAGTDNADVDPEFVRNPGTDSSSDIGNERLAPDSPLLGAGNVAYVTTTTDLAGNPRVVDGSVDMGAYQQLVVYVDAGVSDGTDDGSSWANAYTSLEDALNNAAPGERIDVAGGTYAPSTDGDVNGTFDLPDDVGIYGGYAGSADAEDPDLRDTSTYASTLSGDVGNDNTAYHVLYADNVYGSRLDGFTITDGSAYGSNGPAGGGGLYATNSELTIADCIFSGNSGYISGAIASENSSTLIIMGTVFNNNSAYGAGAIDSEGDSTLIITNSTFSSNQSIGGGGGAIQTVGSTLNATDCTFDSNSAFYGGAITGGNSMMNIVNCLFTNNTATGHTDDGNYGGDGGAIYLFQGSTANITNATFAGNTAQDQSDDDGQGYSYGGAISASDSTVNITNSIMWNDSADYDNEIFTSDDSSVSVTYTDINDTDLATGTGDMDVDPQFVGGANFQLTFTSPVIDAGNNADVPDGITTDLAGNPRIIDGTVDMGAYESAAIPAIYVDAGATGNDDGSTWANAYNTLAAALANVSSGDRIDIAGGSYYPTTGDPTLDADRTSTFTIPEGVSLFGGYEGSNGSNPSYHDLSSFPTILSGDIGSSGDDSDNSYHVVTLTDADSTTILYGLTIRDGNANGTSTESEGGGLLLTSSSPTINNCIIEDNSAATGGGVYDMSSSPTFSDSSISDNTSTSYGAGIYNTSGTLTLENSTVSNNSTPTSAAAGIANFGSGVLDISGTTFSGNSAAGAGGIEDDSTGTITLTNDTFTDNAATGSGGASGAITIAYQTGDNTITGCTFTDNAGNTAGGAIADTEATLTIANCTFATNTARDPGGQGGAIYYSNGFTSAAVSILDCVFDGNSAGLEGGAISDVQGAAPSVVNCLFSLNSAGITGNVAGLGGAVYTSDSSPTFVNCTFASNYVLDPVSITSYGGAMYTTGSGTSTISNCILWNDTADVDNEIDANATVNIDHSDIDDSILANGGTDNIDADPTFVRNPGTNNATDYGDLHLQSGSPAIGAGDASEVPNGVTTDLDGNPRILDGDVDMGAYETPLSS